MRRVLDIVLVLVFLVAVACCPCKNAGASAVVNATDSTYVAHHNIVRMLMRDTMLMRPIRQSHDRNVTKEQFSELSNDYCTSTAEVDSDGLLHHTLDTRDSAMLPVRTVTRDSIVRDTVFSDRDRAETRTGVKEVRKVTWWQRTQSILLWTLLGILAIRYRKEILSLIRRIILWI